MASMNWNPPPPNPSSSSSSSVQSNSQVYPAPTFRNVEYTNNPYSSASFLSSHQHMTSDPLSVQQMPSSIGPSRSNPRSSGIVTRKKAAQIALQNGHVRDNLNSIQNGIQSVNNQQRPNSLGFMNSSSSRVNTPNDYPLTNYQHHQAELPPLSLPSSGPPAMHPNSASPQYTSTPVSASPYSPFNFFNTHSRSNSNSTSNPRSASPALSSASAVTSMSSCTANSMSHPAVSGNVPSIARKHKKQRLFNVDRKEICLYHKENPSARQEDIAIKYGVERSTISKILKHKQKWMNVPEDEELKVAKHRPSKFPEIESELVAWLMSFTASNSTTLSDSLIRSKAREVARNLKISEDKFKASSGWVENFKHRHGIRKGVWHGDGKSMKPPMLGGSNLPPSNSAGDQRGSLLPSFNSRFMSDTGIGNLIGDRSSGTPSILRDVSMEEDGYRPQQIHRPSISSRHAWSPTDRSPVAETISSGSSSSKATSDLSFSRSDAPTSSVSMHSSSMSLRPAWEPHSSQTLDRPANMTSYEQQEPNAVTSVSGSSTQNIPAPSQTPLPSIHPYTSTVTPPPSNPDDSRPYTGLAIYSNMPPIYRPTIDIVPHITEVEDAVDKVLRFIDAQPSGYITPNQREVLTEIKYVLFNTAEGIHQPGEKR